MSLRIVPLTLKAANDFVASVHRHHGAITGGLDYFRVGCVDGEGKLRGVAIVTRPPNRNSDDGTTCEVVRLATDGVHNACSFLYGACARIARAMGFKRLITYTLESEGGASLRAAGWIMEKKGIKSYWQSNQTAGRTVKDRAHYGEKKQRWSPPDMRFAPQLTLKDIL
jgi:hypothetical protein